MTKQKTTKKRIPLRRIKEKAKLLIVDRYTPQQEIFNKLKDFLKKTNFCIKTPEYSFGYALFDKEENEYASIRICLESDYKTGHLHVEVDHTDKDRIIKLFEDFINEKGVNVVIEIK